MPSIVAHRGASQDAPENTLAAFRLAWEQGADAIEGDFRSTRDGQVVCIHDADLRRIGGIARLVAESTLSQLQEVDAGVWKGAKWKGERIPTFEDVLDILPDGKRLFLEIKSGPELLSPIRAILKTRRQRPESMVIISFHPRVIEAAKRILPDLAANWLVAFTPDPATRRWRPSAGDAASTALQVRADGVSFQHHIAADAEFVRELQMHGLSAHVWTVNDAATAARYARLGVGSITTDCPRLLQGIR